ncbi:MAG: hypothetical protein RLY14_3249 [Planctomycetota bacterium]|jgi:hypothetical protein
MRFSGTAKKRKGFLGKSGRTEKREEEGERKKENWVHVPMFICPMGVLDLDKISTPCFKGSVVAVLEAAR